MAADGTAALDEIAELADSQPLSEIHRRRRHLVHEIAAAPRDATTTMTEARDAHDVLTVRARTYTDRSQVVPDELQQRLAALAAKIDAAEQRQARREEWLDEHSDLVGEHHVVTRAERTVEARIRANPAGVLPDHVVRTLGPVPELQRERNAWNAAASAVAVHLARHDITPDPTAQGVDALVGPKPTGAGGSSWKYATERIADLTAATGLQVEVEAAAGAEL